MTPIRIIASLLFLLVCQPSRADLTLRQSFDVKFGSLLPPDAVEAVNQQLASSGFPSEVVTRVKGEKVSSTFGSVTSIIDCSTDQMTLLNPAAKKYATVPMADYPGTLAVSQLNSPAIQKMFQDLKFDVQTNKTGRTGMLNGIRAEEFEMTLSFELPGSHQTPAGFKMVLQQWIASPEESNRIPAIEEFAGYSARVQNKMNSYDVMQKVFAQLPGLGDKLRGPLEELRKTNGSLVLKMHMAGYMPAVAQMFQKMQKEGTPVPAGVDPDAPLFEISMNLAELSTGSVPDAAFLAPADYETAPLEEMLKSAMPVQSLLPGLSK